jgi:predicted outer membrane repeat protein
MIHATLFLLLLVSSAIPISGNAAETVIPTIIYVPGEVSTLQQAIDQISNGGIIELAAGTYISPSGGFGIHDTHKGFTIRAASGAQVTISGSGTHELVRLINSNLSQGGPVIFQGLKFSNGYSNTPGLAGGVTVMQAQATFVDCSFESNMSTQNGSGGGTLVTINSEAFFINSVWQNNSAVVNGGGLVVAEQSKVYIHNAKFLNNRVNLPGHSPVSAGGAIHLGNSTLRISNTRFENNQAGYAGGAIFVIGDWANPVTQPSADLLVVNSTFINNQAERDPGVSFGAPTEGGALHAEAQSRVRIYNSRFITNHAMAGGAIGIYEAELWVEGGSFLGNKATGQSGMGGFGGAITASSNDTTSDGSTNRRVAYINIQDTLIQGRYGSVTTVGLGGGGIYAAGDQNRTYGANGVSQQGTAADNRAQVEINRVVFNDLDVYNFLDGGVGGGMLGDMVALNLQNSLIINSDATGSSKSSGGGLAILNQSLANISGLTFSRNSTDKYGGAIFAQGSELNLSNCNLIENSNPTQYGSAIFAAQDDGRSRPATGTVQTCMFSSNTGLPMIFDDDRTNGPINDMRYNNNQFYSSGGADAKVYKDPIYYVYPIGTENSASQLNDRVVSRNNGTSTDKGSGNTALSIVPTVGKILGAPPQILTTNANGDAAPPTLAYLGYTWSGGSATLDGQAVTGNAGVSSAGTGTHTLSVGGTNFTASISQAPTLAATFTASGASPVTLNWSVTTGTFLDVAIDHGVTITSSSSGSVQVSPPVDMDYWLYIITEEGGIVKSVNTGVPILEVPSTINILAVQNYSVNKGYFTIENDGSGTLQWTATSQTPDLITMDTPNGQTTTLGTITIAFTLNVGSLSPGDYVGTIYVDAGTAGTVQVTVNVKLVSILYKVHLPLVVH